ncbi:MAG: hypothetical protein M1415_07045 [Firmicutes bacterium]|nr:hypothetical protein [Bacillota bacterium]
MASPNLGSMLKRAGIWTILVVLTYVFWKWLAVYVLPFAIAVVIATLLDPMVRWLKQVGLSLTVLPPSGWRWGWGWR